MLKVMQWGGQSGSYVQVGRGQTVQNTVAAMEMGLDEGLAIGEREDRTVSPLSSEREIQGTA